MTTMDVYAIYLRKSRADIERELGINIVGKKKKSS